MTLHRVAALAGFAVFAAPAIALADSAGGVADFYRGKTIEVYVGSPVGGGYNAYARSVGRHIVNHIPGKPQLVVKNMPGAGGRKVTAWVANVGAKDGTVIAASQPGSLVEAVLGDPKNAKYDARKFGYIGSPESWVSVCAARTDAKVKTFKDAFRDQLVVGGGNRGSSLQDTPTVLKHVLGVKFKIIKGYPGSRDVVNAIEKNEVQAICGYAWTSLKSQAGHLWRDKKINILVQTALEPHPELERLGVPMVWDFVKTDEQRAVLEMIFAQQAFGRPMFVPAGVPADRVAALRTAFDATMKDPAFQAELKKQKLELSPMGGKRIHELLMKIFDAPKAVQEKARAALESR